MACRLRRLVSSRAGRGGALSLDHLADPFMQVIPLLLASKHLERFTADPDFRPDGTAMTAWSEVRYSKEAQSLTPSPATSARRFTVGLPTRQKRWFAAALQALTIN